MTGAQALKPKAKPKAKIKDSPSSKIDPLEEQLKKRWAEKAPDVQKKWIKSYKKEVVRATDEYSLKSQDGVHRHQQMIQAYHDQLVLQVEELRVRFLYLTDKVAADKYRYEWLEKHTGIPSARWQNVLLEKQLPTLDMLLAICNLQGGFAHWLIYGSAPKFDDPCITMRPCAPSEEAFEVFRARREWNNQRRKTRAKKQTDSEEP